MSIQTRDELLEEWGQERYCGVMCALSGWWIGKNHPISVKQLSELQSSSMDAFKLFTSLMFHMVSEEE